MTIDILTTAKDNYKHATNIYPFIVQIGTGGTGGYLVQHLAQLLGTSKQAASYVIVDPDVIEEKNLKNQLFLNSEVGLKKADVLASRYSEAYGLSIGSYSESYMESLEQLKGLFNTDYLRISHVGPKVLFLPIVIGCVDNNFTRKLLHELFDYLKVCIYVDAGNESTDVPKDWMVRSKDSWTPEELLQFAQSGWSGQVVTGAKLPNFYQKPVAEMFPDILEDNDSIAPSELSCTQLTASEPQRLLVNKYAALIVTGLVTEIIEEHSISNHVTFFHAKKLYMRSVPVQIENPTS
ncbi:MAG: ThiF family adenylyltransferase [Paenisporosarcina sp.]|nr:ThiF family adenylyltransferase [Paenisporosarcina sp.]